MREQFIFLIKIKNIFYKIVTDRVGLNFLIFSFFFWFFPAFIQNLIYRKPIISKKKNNLITCFYFGLHNYCGNVYLDLKKSLIFRPSFVKSTYKFHILLLKNFEIRILRRFHWIDSKFKSFKSCFICFFVEAKTYEYQNINILLIFILLKTWFK